MSGRREDLPKCLGNLHWSINRENMLTTFLTIRQSSEVSHLQKFLKLFMISKFWPSFSMSCTCCKLSKIRSMEQLRKAHARSWEGASSYALSIKILGHFTKLYWERWQTLCGFIFPCACLCPLHSSIVRHHQKSEKINLMDQDSIKMEYQDLMFNSSYRTSIYGGKPELKNKVQT